MRRSKLETCIDILRVLAHSEPMKLTHIMYKINVNCSVLEAHLDFLIQQGLVKERTVGKKGIFYVVTQRGRIVVRAFRELNQVLSLTEESKNKTSISH